MRRGASVLGLVALGFCAGHPLNAQSSTIRMAAVITPDDLLRELLPEFERQTGLRVEINVAGDAVYAAARRGQADLVISHYGLPGVDAFVSEGLGFWPRPVFANQAALVGPATDPAGIRGLTDAVEAFRRIAQSRSPFVVNSAPTELYLSQVLWEGAGRPDPGGWYVDQGLREEQAVMAAASRGGYTTWGLVPFLRWKAENGQAGLSRPPRSRAPAEMQVLVAEDSLFQRFMVTVVVNPDRIAGVNVEGARALENFLIRPATQARIRAFRYPGLDVQPWWPFGRHNTGAVLQGR